METIDWWDREFRFLREIGILDHHLAPLTPAAGRVSTIARGDLARRALAAHPPSSPDQDQDGIPMGRLEIETGGRVTPPADNDAS